MHSRLKTFLIHGLCFAAGVTATLITIDMTKRHDYADQLARIERVQRAQLQGADEALRVKRFAVSIDEVSNKFVFAEPFEGSFQKTLTMSDGSTRTIRLKPLVHKNERVIALEDNGKTTYMGMNGTTTNGRLMVQINELGD